MKTAKEIVENKLSQYSLENWRAAIEDAMREYSEKALNEYYINLFKDIDHMNVDILQNELNKTKENLR